MSLALPALMLALAIAPADGATTAAAEKVAAAAPAPTSALPGMINGNAFFLVGAASQNPYLFGGVALDGGVILALGLGATYDGALASNPFSAFAVLHAEYMVKNMPNYAFGPELTVILPFAPTAFSSLTFAPGFAFWYAPFSAPLLLGAALDVNLVYTLPTATTPGSFAFGTVTPGVRLAYVF